jgi:hypothetical protein
MEIGDLTSTVQRDFERKYFFHTEFLFDTPFSTCPAVFLSISELSCPQLLLPCARQKEASCAQQTEASCAQQTLAERKLGVAGEGQKDSTF